MIQRHIDLETGIVRTTMSSQVTGQDLREHFEAIHDLGAGRCLELVDARGVWMLSATASDLPALASAGRRIFSREQVAPRAVVVSDVIHFGIGRLFAAAAAPWVQIHMFESMELAETWLLTRIGAWPLPAALRSSTSAATPGPRIENVPARGRLRLVHG